MTTVLLHSRPLRLRGPIISEADGHPSLDHVVPDKREDDNSYLRRQGE